MMALYGRARRNRDKRMRVVRFARKLTGINPVDLMMMRTQPFPHKWIRMSTPSHMEELKRQQEGK